MMIFEDAFGVDRARDSDLLVSVVLLMSADRLWRSTRPDLGTVLTSLADISYTCDFLCASFVKYVHSVL